MRRSGQYSVRMLGATKAGPDSAVPGMDAQRLLADLHLNRDWGTIGGVVGEVELERQRKPVAAKQISGGHLQKVSPPSPEFMDYCPKLLAATGEMK